MTRGARPKTVISSEREIDGQLARHDGNDECNDFYI